MLQKETLRWRTSSPAEQNAHVAVINTFLSKTCVLELIMVGRTSSACLKCKRQHLGGKGDYKSMRKSLMKDETLQKTTNEQKQEEQRVVYRMADLLERNH